MNDLALLLAFVAAATVLTLTPGVDTALVLRAALVQGRWAAALAALGIGLGCLAWGAGVALGLGVLLQVSEVGYTTVRLAGAAYLLWTGGRLLLRPRSAMSEVPGEGVSGEGAEALRTGLLTNLLNPKVGVFYVTFLPQFLPAGVDAVSFSVLLAAVHAAEGVLWFSVLILATRQPMASDLRFIISAGRFTVGRSSRMHRMKPGAS
jgi:threonine/homoserine/homoserine lactone efflux protein